MQSKTSFFNLINKTIIKKNTKRFWPIWSLYTLISLVMFPAVLYFENVIGFFVGQMERQRITLNVLYFDLIPESLGLAFIFSIIIAICVFGYMDEEISCNMYHSLPITRECHFATGYVSGLLMLFIPNLLMFVLSSLVFIRFDVAFFVPLLTWLVIITVEELFFFSLAALCVILTGHAFVAVITYIGISFFVNIVVTIINSLYSLLFIGFDDRLFYLPNNFMGIISPVYFFSKLESSSYNPTEFAAGDVYEVNNFVMVIVTALVAIVILVLLGLWAYRKRKSESAGEVISISWLKPVFRVVFSYILASGITAFIVDLLFNELKYSGDIKIITASLLVIFSIIWFLIAQMILTGSFRIFSGFVKHITMFAACTVVIVAASLVYGNYSEGYVPEPSKVKEVRMQTVNLDTIVSDKDVIQNVSKFHRYLLDNSDAMIENEYRYFSKLYFRLIYIFEDGSKTERVYYIPYFLPDINEKLENLLKVDQAEFLLGAIRTNRFPYKATAYNYIENTDATVTLTRKNDIEELINAILADLNEGNTDLIDLYDISLDMMDMGYFIPEEGNYAYETTGYQIAYDEKAVLEPSYQTKDIIEFLYQDYGYGKYGYRDDYVTLTISDRCVNVLSFLREHGF